MYLIKILFPVRFVNFHLILLKLVKLRKSKFKTNFLRKPKEKISKDLRLEIINSQKIINRAPENLPKTLKN